jgi:UDP-glucose 4-epimerase
VILVTGGAGYIGSHTCVELLQAGYDVTVFDNFSNGHQESPKRVRQITGTPLRAFRGDVRDRAALVAALHESGAQSVIHFAGSKAVGESVQRPLDYYDNNVTGSLRILEAMDICGIKTLVFSSSATVYGDPQRLPLTEDHPLSATNPYGQTKLTVEHMLRDLQRSDRSWRIGILRYFNPVGAHASGLIGEDPRGTPNNLMPFIAQVAIGRRRPYLNIFGDDYPTPDGTGVRDYIHVVDLAIGHLKALEALRQWTNPTECLTVNLGTGTGSSVLALVAAFELASKKRVAYKIAPRRPGDVAACYVDPSKAAILLGWRAERSLVDMCADTWRWQSLNPHGYNPSHPAT